MGAFRKAGRNVIAFPAGYLSHSRRDGLPSFDLLDRLGVASVALHEWIGLPVYRAMGYTDDIFPSRESRRQPSWRAMCGPSRLATGSGNRFQVAMNIRYFGLSGFTSGGRC